MFSEEQLRRHYPDLFELQQAYHPYSQPYSDREYEELFSYSDYPSSSSSRHRRQSLLIVMTFLVEVTLLVAVVVIEYYLRWTDVFPVRRQNFTCSDVNIACTSSDKELMSEFAFSGKVPDTVIYCLTFCAPPLLVGSMLESTGNALLAYLGAVPKPATQSTVLYPIAVKQDEK
ncbi:hypothetical protein ACOMHN_061319 [Nucella lapillus]